MRGDKDRVRLIVEHRGQVLASFRFHALMPVYLAFAPVLILIFVFLFVLFQPVEGVGGAGAYDDDSPRSRVAREIYMTRVELNRIAQALEKAQLQLYVLEEADRFHVPYMVGRNAMHGGALEAQKNLMLANNLSAFADVYSTRLARTPHAWPVRGVRHSINSGFGWRSRPTRRFHRGVDLKGYTGALVIAPADGTVTRVRQSNHGYGNLIEIEHGNGFRTRFAHLSSIHARMEQRVRSGEVIGQVGSTGFSTGPHLHYEIHRNDEPINPRHYLGIAD